MKFKHIHIAKGNQVPSDPEKDTKVISLTELGQWAKTGKILSHLFRYDSSRLIMSNWEQTTSPFSIALLLRLLSRGDATIQMESDRSISVTSGYVFRLFLRYLRDRLKIPTLLVTCERETAHLRIATESSLRDKPLDLNHPSVYLRTDHFPEPLAGGSIGHTLGVLNHLPLHSQGNAFISSIPFEIHHPDITMAHIPYPGKFRDFREAMYLDYNRSVLDALKKHLHHSKVSFVYQRYSTHNYAGLKYCQENRIPFVLEYNGSEIWVHKQWATRLKHEALAESIELANLHGADVVVAVSEASKDELVQRGVDPDKILVNPNGVEPDQFHSDIDGTEIRIRYHLEGKFIIGFIGTFGKWHGAEVLARAFGQLLEKHPHLRDNVRLLMIGSGNTLEKVKEELKQHGASNESVLTGTVPQKEAPFFLGACNILVSPHVPNPDGTPFFGSPTKLFEYMAMGKGIVASDLDQIGEILQHDQNAILVTPGDSQNLMEGIHQLIVHPEKSKRLGEAARREVLAKYTWESHTLRIVEKLKERCPCL